MEIQERERRTSFIHFFDKTPPGIVCPHFYVLSHSNGCLYSCHYCYLNLTFRGLRRPIVYSNLDRLQKEVQAWLANTRERSVLSAGELSDSLAFDGWTRLTEILVPLFAHQRRHLLLLVTKSTNIGNLTRLRPTEQVVVSFSVNAQPVAARYEKGSPSSRERLQAASRLASQGWRIRLRIDPIIPIAGWRSHYTRLAEAVSRIPAETITLGSLRFFPGLPAHAKGPTDVFSFASNLGDPDGRWRLPFEIRREAYGLLMDLIGPRARFGLCKETIPMHQALGLPHQRVSCNCTR